MKIGILRETKTPPDRRVPFSPLQCKELLENFSELEIVIQPSAMRCFADKEYESAGIQLSEDLSDCDILMGVKEVEIDTFIENKTYLFFSHTAKEQNYNRGLLQAAVEKGITLVDYEYLTRQDSSRVVAFGKWAGIVGAYNGLIAYGKLTGSFDLKAAGYLSGLTEMKKHISGLEVGQARIVLTGGGRVASGAVEILKSAGIREVSPEEFLNSDYEFAVFCRLDPWHYTRRKDGQAFAFEHFIEHPSAYENSFLPYALRADMYIACHFWDPDSPKILSAEDLRTQGLPLRIIADISCDIAGPIASTLRASSIAEPLYGYDPETGKETSECFGDKLITVMAVDNLPGELPRDASGDFGKALYENVMPSLILSDEEGIVERATILKEGRLTKRYSYLRSFLEGK